MPLAIHNKSPKTYIIAGCFGSGTSFISKALQNQGVNMGYGSNEEFREDLEFVSLNTDIISLYGGGDETKHLVNIKDGEISPLIIKERIHKRIKALVEKKKGNFWGAKDPRFALTLKEYLPYLEDDVYLVAIFRKPDQMLNSPSSQWDNNKTSLKIINKINQEMIDTIHLFLNNMPKKKAKKKIVKNTKEVEILDNCIICGKELVRRDEKQCCAWCREFDERGKDLE